MIILDEQIKQYRAKKEHRCALCGGEIHINEVYSYQKVFGEGQIKTNKYHTHCLSIMAGLIDANNIPYERVNGVSVEDFEKYIYDYISEYHKNGYSWHNKSFTELVRKVYNEINKKTKCSKS